MGNRTFLRHGASILLGGTQCLLPNLKNRKSNKTQRNGVNNKTNRLRVVTTTLHPVITTKTIRVRNTIRTLRIDNCHVTGDRECK
jgi:hypothetical protein